MLSARSDRWQLYRLLSDPARLRLLALASVEELSVGELAELLSESQPNVSRQAAPLRQQGLLLDRRQGTRTLVRLAPDAERDPVIADALQTGRTLCDNEGRLARVQAVVRARDEKTREFFERPRHPGDAPLALELPAYLWALSGVLDQRRELALDAGTGDGALLDILAPLYAEVVGLDRSEAQLARARQRVSERGYSNVRLVCSEIDDDRARSAVGAGADVVVAARMLHHAPLPRDALRALAALCKPGGRVVVIDYARHEDEQLREQQADVWMGFEQAELAALASSAGLEVEAVKELPRGYVRNDVDSHIPWQILIAVRPTMSRSVALVRPLKSSAKHSTKETNKS